MTDVYRDSSTNFEGSAQEELDVYLSSIEGHQQRLSEAWSAMWQHGTNTGLINGVLDFGSGILEVADDVGLLNTAMGTLGGLIGGFGNVGRGE